MASSLRPPPRRQQADASLDQADVAFQRGHRACAVHLQFAAAAECQAAHCSDHRHERIFHAQTGRLEVRDHRLQSRNLAALHEAEHALEIRARRERIAVLPDHQALEVFLGFVERALQAVEHGVVDRVHLGLERDDADVVAKMPKAQAVVLPDRRTGIEFLADQCVGEDLAPVDRMARARLVLAAVRRVGACGVMHAVHLADPVRQRRAAHRLARSNVLGDPAGDLAPAGPTARFRTDRVSSRSPSGSRSRHRARSRRCRQDGTRCNGTGRGTRPRGIAPAHPAKHAAWRTSRPGS